MVDDEDGRKLDAGELLDLAEQGAGNGFGGGSRPPPARASRAGAASRTLKPRVSQTPPTGASRSIASTMP
jgi:hypothetical protein